MARRYGWIRQHSDKRDRQFKVMRAVPPAEIDLRSFCAPVRNQGQSGACTGFMARGAIMFERNRQKLTGVDDVSPQFIYWCERSEQGTTGSDSGSTIREAYKVINTYGACLESDCPYTLPVGMSQPPKTDAFVAAVNDKTVQYESVEQSIDGVRSVLGAGLAMGFGFIVYESFESDAVAKTGQVLIPAVTTENVLGGHAVLLVGDQPDKYQFIVQNSWGPDWGDKGFFYMPYDYLLDPDLASDFWAVQLV